MTNTCLYTPPITSASQSDRWSCNKVSKLEGLDRLSLHRNQFLDRSYKSTKLFLKGRVHGSVKLSVHRKLAAHMNCLKMGKSEDGEKPSHFRGPDPFDAGVDWAEEVDLIFLKVATPLKTQPNLIYGCQLFEWVLEVVPNTDFILCWSGFKPDPNFFTMVQKAGSVAKT